jgi:hypothetical protein
LKRSFRPAFVPDSLLRGPFDEDDPGRHLSFHPSHRPLLLDANRVEIQTTKQSFSSARHETMLRPASCPAPDFVARGASRTPIPDTFGQNHEGAGQGHEGQGTKSG